VHCAVSVRAADCEWRAHLSRAGTRKIRPHAAASYASCGSSDMCAHSHASPTRARFLHAFCSRDFHSPNYILYCVGRACKRMQKGCKSRSIRWTQLVSGRPSLSHVPLARSPPAHFCGRPIMHAAPANRQIGGKRAASCLLRPTLTLGRRQYSPDGRSAIRLGGGASNWRPLVRGTLWAAFARRWDVARPLRGCALAASSPLRHFATGPPVFLLGSETVRAVARVSLDWPLRVCAWWRRVNEPAGDKDWRLGGQRKPVEGAAGWRLAGRRWDVHSWTRAGRD